MQAGPFLGQETASGRKFIVALSGPLTADHPADAAVAEFRANGGTIPVILENELVVRGNLPAATRSVLQKDRITAPFVLEGPMTGEMFKAYIEQFLAPTLTGVTLCSWTTSVFIKSMESKKPLRLAAQFRFISLHIAPI